MLKKFLAIPLLAALVGGAGAIATTAAPASAQYLPPGYFYRVQPNTIGGAVSYFYAFNMTVVGPNGSNIPVQLHQGTIIAPLGATIVPGMRVIVRGYWSNGVFFANRIRIR